MATTVRCCQFSFKSSAFECESLAEASVRKTGSKQKAG